MIRKLEKYFYYLLLFSIPFQARKILWHEGWRFNEWTAISVYITDILLGVLILFWIFNVCCSAGSKLKTKGEKLKVYEYFLILFLVISAISIKNSSNYIVSWYQWLKLVEFVLFFFYLKKYAIYRFSFSNSLFTVFYGGILQAVIAIIQFWKQSNVGLRYLGESIFNSDMSGIATFYSLYGDKVIRPYGTMPHPNVLAAYLFLALFGFYFAWFYRRIKYDKLLMIAHLVSLWAFFLTFARVAIFALGANYFIRGFLLFVKYKKFKSKRLWQIIACTGAVMILFSGFYWPEIISRIKVSGEEDAVQLRNFYNQESVKNISWLGTGMGDFVIELSEKVPFMPAYMYQPVHNIYLLIFSETGILGISAFILFLVFLIRDFIIRTRMERFHHYSLILLLGSFLFMGLFDHYLWTLQQGRFLLWMVLAVIAVDESDDLSG